MSKPIYRVLGVKQATSTKTGRECFTIYLSGDFTPYEKENCECAGFNCFSEFTYENYNLHPNDVVELDYTKGFQDKATLSGVTVIKSPFLEKTVKSDEKEVKAEKEPVEKK